MEESIRRVEEQIVGLTSRSIAPEVRDLRLEELALAAMMRDVLN